MMTVLNLHHFILPLWSRYVFHLDHMLSTLLNSSPNTSTNLIIITDSLRPKKARQILTGLLSKLSIMEPLLFQMISNTIGKFLSEKVIREKFGSIQSNEVTTFMMSEEFQKRKSESLPDLKVEFLDVNSIFSKYKATVQGMKKYFGPNNKTVWIPPGDLRYIKCIVKVFILEKCWKPSCWLNRKNWNNLTSHCYDFEGGSTIFQRPQTTTLLRSFSPPGKMKKYL